MTWLEREIQMLKLERHGKPRKVIGFRQWMILAFIVFSTIGYTQCSAGEIECPHCYNVIEYEVKGILKDTWICPNKKCGYENYDGIEYCCLCGTKRKR